jgi:hypothetical protein
MQDQDKTKQTLIEYFTVLNDFQDILTKLKSSNVSYISYIINFLNLQFDYPITDGHFYHFISEAWILSVFNSLKIKYMKELEDSVLMRDKCDFLVLNKSFREILDDIQYVNIDVNFFIDSLEVLLGTFRIHDPVIKVTQMKLSQLYLKKINIARAEKMDIPDTLTREQFEKILFTYMLYGLGYTLNELDPNVTDKNSKTLIDAYTKLDNTDEFEVSFEKYVDELNKQLQRKMAESEIEILNTEQTFFNFAKYRFDDIFQNVKIFNVNMGNPEVLLFGLGVERIIKLFTSLRELTRFVIKNSEIRLITSYLYRVAGLVGSNKFIIAETAVTAMQGIANLRDWVKNGLESDVIRGNRMFVLLNDGKDYLYKTITECNVCTNIRNVVAFTTGTTYNVVMNISSWSKEAIMKYTDYLRTTVVEGLSAFKNNVFGGDPMIKISSDNEKYLHLEIRKDITLSKTKLFDLFNEIINKFMAFDLVDYTKQTANYLVAKFKAIVGSDYTQTRAKLPTPHTSNIQVELSSSNISNTPK